MTAAQTALTNFVAARPRGGSLRVHSTERKRGYTIVANVRRRLLVLTSALWVATLVLIFLFGRAPVSTNLSNATDLNTANAAVGRYKISSADVYAQAEV